MLISSSLDHSTVPIFQAGVHLIGPITLTFISPYEDKEAKPLRAFLFFPIDFFRSEESSDQNGGWSQQHMAQQK